MTIQEAPDKSVTVVAPEAATMKRDEEPTAVEVEQQRLHQELRQRRQQILTRARRRRKPEIHLFTIFEEDVQDSVHPTSSDGSTDEEDSDDESD